MQLMQSWPNVQRIISQPIARPRHPAPAVAAVGLRSPSPCAMLRHMRNEFPSTITIDGVTLTLQVERKPVKNINARLHDRVLRVSVPFQAARAVVDHALPDLARRLLRRQRARQVNDAGDALALAQRVAYRFPQPLNVAAVQFTTTQTACWGSYSTRTHTIRLNAVLRLMPPWVLEAVVAHELAHAIHPNHSPAFWALLHQVCPETERAQAFLEGVNWLARSWNTLPPVERSQLLHPPEGSQGEVYDDD